MVGRSELVEGVVSSRDVTEGLRECIKVWITVSACEGAFVRSVCACDKNV